jgi:hypothetical protein
VGKVEALALDTEVYNAEAWQKLLVRTVPEMKFARMLSGWNRRADADSKGALAFYLFKMALARDASLTEPADSISVPRLRAALTRAEDQVETELDFNATWGTYFRIVREGARTSSPASGGLRPEAGISTPRTLLFRENRAYAGQAATRVVELSATPSARSLIPPEQAKFKPTYFRNRRELQRSASSVKTLTVP